VLRVCRVVNQCLVVQGRPRKQSRNRNSCYWGSIKCGWWIELTPSPDQPLQGQTVCTCLNVFLSVWNLYLLSDKTSTLSASSFNEMYNRMKYHPESIVARVTTDRTVRSHIPSTVKKQLWRSQLLKIVQWNVRSLLEQETADQLERCTALAAMELAKYNIDTAALCEMRFSESWWLEYSFREGRLEWTLLSIRKLWQTDRNPTASRWQKHDDEIPLSRFVIIFNVYVPTMTNSDKTRRNSTTSWQMYSETSRIQISYWWWDIWLWMGSYAAGILQHT